MSNPLTATHAHSPLPAFDQIKPEHAEPALDVALAQNRAELKALLEKNSAPNWNSLIEPLEEMSDQVSRVWGPVQHLFGVTSTADWRKAFNAGLPKLTEYGLELAQSEPLYRAYEALAASAEYPAYSGARKKVIKDALRDFKLSGIALPENEKARFKEISLKLSELQTRFEENLMDSMQAWSKLIADEAQLEGMTAEARAAAREKARSRNLEGWLLTLDFPSYDAVITYAKNRDLRFALYSAYSTRASEQGGHDPKHDNTPLMEEILKLRHEQATLLGYSNFAGLSLATKMADSPDEVEKFLLDLARRAKSRAEAEREELKEFARQLDGVSDFQPWDLPYYAEKLKHEKLGLSDEELKPYFPADQVIAGMFELVQKLYGIRIGAVAGIPAWHPDVTTYAVKDAAGKQFALFYLDPYARDDKRSGAWMDECVARRRTAEGIQQPAAYLTCNFTPPLAGSPALLTHEEVLTLFHEFGHGLHHLLTRVDEASVAGIRGVAWDAVELPSQFMENWCFDPATLRRFARHHQTGQPMPEEMIAKLRASRTWHSGLATMRQVEFALFDLRLHRDYLPAKGARVLETLNKVRSEVAVVMPPDWNRMPNSFSHVFAGGYAAGYYSYKWAEVLSADAYAAFEESNFAPQTGEKFRDTILAQGGSKEAMELFIEFRGRRPSVEPLLRQSGLAEKEPA